MCLGLRGPPKRRERGGPDTGQSRKGVEDMEQRSQASVQELQEKIAAIFRGVGVPGPDADIAADALMDAEISGVESHGLTRLKAYVDRITNGQMNPAPEIQIETRGAVARVDGGNGMGQVVAARAAQLCVQLAKQYGIGAAAVHRSNHFGTAAYYANRVARAGCVGFCATNAGPTMAPFGGMDLLLGTNPFAVAFPARDQIFSADMATSAVAKGKIRIYEKKNEPIPVGWALDREGRDTTDPHEAVDGILLPMGGHKGYALSMAVDALCGLLTGARLSGESVSMFQSSQSADVGHFICAIDIAHFLPAEQFEARAQEWFDRLRSSRPRPGMSILIPGEPEARRRQACGGEISVLTETLRTVNRYYEQYGRPENRPDRGADGARPS